MVDVEDKVLLVGGEFELELRLKKGDGALIASD